MGGKLFRRGAYAVLVGLVLFSWLGWCYTGVSFGEGGPFLAPSGQATAAGAYTTLLAVAHVGFGAATMIVFSNY